MRHFKTVLGRKKEPEQNASKSIDDNKTGLKIWKEPASVDKPIVDVVFVHDLTGKRTTTWLADGTDSPWPQVLLPDLLPEARIITWGYDADIVHFIKPAGQNTVRQHARNLIEDLTNLRYQTSTSSRHIIFVVHSLGGLVCENALLLSSESLEDERVISTSTIGVMFLGTPHAGSDLSTFALAVGYFIKFSLVKNPNTSNLAILKHDSETLAAIQESFSTMLMARERGAIRPIKIHCCIEELPVMGLGRRVVEPDSARFPGYHSSCTIPANHMTMTKFSSVDEVGFERISARLRRWIDDANADPGTNPLVTAVQTPTGQAFDGPSDGTL